MSDQATDHIPDTVVVLAGGLGTRLRPVLHSQPKVLAPVDGKPFLGYLIEYLADQGLVHFIFSVGYLAEQVIAYIGDGSRWKIKASFSQETSPLGTAGAIRLASDGLKQPFFAINGDTLYTISFQTLWQAHVEHKALATIGLRKLSDTQSEVWQRGCVKLSSRGLIESFNEKPARLLDDGENNPTLTNGGIYVFDPAALEGMGVGQAASLETSLFPALAERGCLAGHVLDGYFVDIGTPESLAAFEADLKDSAPGVISLWKVQR